MIRLKGVYVYLRVMITELMDKFRKTVLIVEDEPAIAEDLSDILEHNGYRVCEVAYDYNDAVQYLDQSKPDLVLLDINLNSAYNGLDLARSLRDKYKVPFIFLTSYADAGTIAEVVDLKPHAYLVKPYKEKDIVTTLALTFAKLDFSTSSFPSIDSLEELCTSRLSKQEYKVLQLLVEANTNVQIGKLLFLSVNTIKSHVTRIYKKMNVNNRLEAVQKVHSIM